MRQTMIAIKALLQQVGQCSAVHTECPAGVTGPHDLSNASFKIDSFLFSFPLHWAICTGIWIKLGADKVGYKPVSTMKFNFQIVNIHQPNSVNNTINFSFF